MTNRLPPDELLVRLRARAEDPARRTSSPPSRFTAEVRTMDLGGLLGALGALGGQLRGVVAANAAGRPDAAASATARDLEARMTNPAPSVLPGPATAATIEAFERRTGVTLPALLRRVYAEVADGGFGPGEGILPLGSVVDEYEALREGSTLPRGRSWPEGLLPLVAMDPGWDCVDAATGSVIAFDPEELAERVSDRRWTAAFRELHADVGAWLGEWVGSRTSAEILEIEMRTMRERGAWRHIRSIQAMTPAQRAAMGLEQGWEARMAAGMGVPWPPPEEPPAGS